MVRQVLWRVFALGHIQEVQELEEAARPAVEQADGHSIGLLGEESSEMHRVRVAVSRLDGHCEIGERVDVLLGLSPVVLIQPVVLHLHQPFASNAILAIRARRVLVRLRANGGELEQGLEVGELLVRDVRCEFGGFQGCVAGDFVVRHGGYKFTMSH